MKMNERQRRFVECYASNPNATAAAVAAGYSPRTARSQGQRLLTNVDVQAYLQELQAEARAERIATADEVRQFWTSVLRDDEQKTEHRIKAGELLMKSGGEMVQRVDIQADVDLDADVEGDVVFYIPDNGRKIIIDPEEGESSEKEKNRTRYETRPPRGNG